MVKQVNIPDDIIINVGADQGRSHQNLSGQVEITGFNLIWCL